MHMATCLVSKTRKSLPEHGGPVIKVRPGRPHSQVYLKPPVVSAALGPARCRLQIQVFFGMKNSSIRSFIDEQSQATGQPASQPASAQLSLARLISQSVGPATTSYNHRRWIIALWDCQGRREPRRLSPPMGSPATKTRPPSQPHAIPAALTTLYSMQTGSGQDEGSKVWWANRSAAGCAQRFNVARVWSANWQRAG